MDNLGKVRMKLRGLEDSIIFTALERSIYSFDSDAYTGGKFMSFMENFENSVVKTGGYNAVEEVPFFIKKKVSGCNNEVYRVYIDNVLPSICKDGENNEICSFEKDIMLMRLISRRIHLGIFVAMAKYEADTNGYINLVKKNNKDGIMTLLTDLKTEEQVLERVYDKASIYIKGFDVKSDINLPEYFSNLYKNVIIPLTKSVELEYLMNINIPEN